MSLMSLRGYDIMHRYGPGFSRLPACVAARIYLYKQRSRQPKRVQKMLLAVRITAGESHRSGQIALRRSKHASAVIHLEYAKKLYEIIAAWNLIDLVERDLIKAQSCLVKGIMVT